MSVGPGQDPLSQQQQSALASALARTGPPNNPKTLAQRTDPQYLWLSKLHTIRKAIDETIQESLDDRPPEEQTLITSLRHSIDRLIRGVKGNEVSLKLASSVVEGLAPQIAQQLDAQLEQMTRPTLPGPPQLTGMAPPAMPPQGAPPGPAPGGMGGGMPPMMPPGGAAPPPPLGG